MSVPGQAKTLLLKIRDHAIARAVAAGRGDFYGKFCQDCPEFVCARRFVRMKCANGTLFRQFLRDRPRRREIENKNLKSAQQAPNGLVIVRRSLFTKVRSESVHKRTHGVIGRAGAINPAHEGRGITQLSRPRQDILISPVNFVRCFGNRDRQFIATGQKLRFARCLHDLADDGTEDRVAWARN